MDRKGIEKKKKNRWMFIKKLYETSQERPGAHVRCESYDMGKELGLTENETREVVQYLRKDGLIKSDMQGVWVSITHEGEQYVEDEILNASEKASINHVSLDYQIGEMQETRNKNTTDDYYPCGPLAKPKCHQRYLIQKNFSGNNIFFDIPYTSYEDRETTLREVVEIAELKAIVGKDKPTSDALLCKICREIQSCKYGLSDISLNRDSVIYELGLMHGLGLKTCILMQKNSIEKFSDILGLEHQEYNGESSLKINLAKWLIHNVKEANINALNQFVREQENEFGEKGDNYYHSIVSSLNDIVIKKSEEYCIEKLNIGFNEKNISFDSLPFFHISATPIPLKEDSIDTGDKSIQEIILNPPPLQRVNGSDMSFTTNRNDLTPTSNGILKRLTEINWELKLFRNGYIEFRAPVDEMFSYNRDNNEFNAAVITKLPVSFIRLAKKLSQNLQFKKSYILTMAYTNCGQYQLMPSAFTGMDREQHKDETKTANLDGFKCQKVFEQLDMDSDIEAFLVLERLYNYFGFYKEQIPFFNKQNIFEIKLN